MNFRHYTFMGALSALAVGGVLLAPNKASAIEAGVEELTRGPVHEAFAASVSFDPTPGILVRMAPPAMIEEVPPEQRLEGDNVSWIPGYWGWDEEQNDFIWISGIWRNLPPGRQWVPGYWAATDGQWQWTSGYWADEAEEEIAYLPEPPKSIESGPNVDAPSSNDVWISGNWRYRDDRYAWQPGYWQPAQQNWMWVPAHYQWTRRGYVFVGGYWDYNVNRRGVVFAPVRFRRDVYDRPGYSYTPSTVIVLNVFLNHLFVRPSYGHYYFGDYYAPRYREEGYYAGYSYQSGRRGYDPIYVHSRWEHRDDNNWERSRREDFDFYRDHEEARPPRTWAALSAMAAGSRKAQRDNFEFAQPFNAYVNNRESRQSFQAVGKKEREQIVGKRREMTQFAQQRQKLEDRAMEKPAEGGGKPAVVVREKFNRSPVVAKRAEQLPGKEAPPKVPVPRKIETRDPKEAPQLPDGVIRPGDKGTPDKQAVPGRGEKSPDAEPGKNRTPESIPDKKVNPPMPDRKVIPDKPETKDRPRPDRGPDVEKVRKPEVVPNRPEPEVKRPDLKPADKKVQPPERQVQPKVAPRVVPERKPEPAPRKVDPPVREKTAPEPVRRPESAPPRQMVPERKPVPPPRQIAPPVQPNQPLVPRQPKDKEAKDGDKEKSRN